MNNNFMGGSINHGNGWATTSDPRGDIYHYTGQQNNHRNDFSDRFSHGHNVMHEHARNHSRMQQIHQQEAKQALREHEERERADRERVEREQRERVEREHREHVERERHAREQRETRERHEQDIKRSQCDSSSNHQKAVQLRREESDSRSTVYKIETNNVFKLIEDQTYKNISSSLALLKEKKALGEKWLKEIKELLIIQNNHIPMINRHFENCVRDVRASDQNNEIKDRLSSRWIELRNIEVSNKKMIIGFSQREIDEITKFMTTVDKSIISLNEKLSSINNRNEINNIINGPTANNAIQDESLIRKLNSAIPPFMVSVPKSQGINPITDIASTAGKIVSVPVVAADMVEGIVNTVIHPIDTAKSLYQFAKSDNKLETVDNALAAKFKQIKLEEEKGTIAGAFKAGLEQGKLTTEVANLAMGLGAIPKVSKFAIVKGAEVAEVMKEGAVLATKVSASPVVKATEIANEGAILAAKAEAFVIDAQSAKQFVSLGDKYPVVKRKDTKIQWGYPIDKQGLPWEDFLEPSLAPTSRLHKKFKTFDFFDKTNNTAISAKTLNTITPARIADPQELYATIKDHINKAIDFRQYAIKGVELKASMIDKRELWIAVPDMTTKEQWIQIEKGIDYGKINNIEVKVTRIAE